MTSPSTGSSALVTVSDAVRDQHFTGVVAINVSDDGTVREPIYVPGPNATSCGFWISLPFSFGGRPLPDHIIRPDAIFISNWYQPMHLLPGRCLSGWARLLAYH